MEKINILMEINDDCYKESIETINSIKTYNDFDINLYVIYSSLIKSHLEKLTSFMNDNNYGKFIPLFVDYKDFLKPFNNKERSTYLKLYAPFLLKDEVDKILYIDNDVICTGDISKLYKTDFDGKTIIGVEHSFENGRREHFKRLNFNDDYKYINDDVLLIDVKKYTSLLKKDTIEQDILENNDNYPFKAQDFINKEFENKIKIIDNTYNYQINQELDDELKYDVVLVNYCGEDKPWNFNYYSIGKAIPFYNYLDKIGKSDLKESLINSIYDDNVDIIMPLYNDRKHLPNSLSSLCNQVNKEHFKLYIVDDGSSLTYDDIIDQFKDKIEIHYIKMPRNGGCGYARNGALKECHSGYFMFMDADDVLYDNYSFDSMYQAMIDTRSDIVNGKRVDELPNKEFFPYPFDHEGTHARIYSRKFVDRYKIRFPHIKFYEDLVFNFMIRMCGATSVDVDKIVYIRKSNDESVSRSSYTDDRDVRFYMFEVYLTCAVALKREYKKHRIRDYLIKYFYRVYERLGYYLVAPISEETSELAHRYVSRMIRIYKMVSDDFETEFVKGDKYEDGLIDFLKYCESYEPYNLDDRISSGLIYKIFDEEFDEETNNRISLVEELNACSKNNNKEQISDITNKLFSNNVKIEPPVICDKGLTNVTIGNNTKIGSNVCFDETGKINIGENVVIGSNVRFLTKSNLISPNLRKLDFIYSKNITIEDNVFIGDNSIIYPGVTISQNSYVYPGSVVTENVNKDAIVMGNPCKEIKEVHEFDDFIYDTNKIIDVENILSDL